MLNIVLWFAVILQSNITNLQSAGLRTLVAAERIAAANAQCSQQGSTFDLYFRFADDIYIMFYI